MPETVASNQAIPILLNLLAAMVGASGQYLYKLGGTRIGLVPVYRNWPLFGGIVLFCAVMGLFVTAFKLGGRMSVVYPAYATTFAWGTLIAVMVGKEPWSGLQLFGVGTITAGVVLVALGGAG